MPINIDAKQVLKQDESNFFRMTQKQKTEFIHSQAKKLHKNGLVYSCYGALDGLSLSYSMIKYAFCILEPQATADNIHDWLLTPYGILTATVSSTFLIIFSTLANKEEWKKKYLIQLWPYIRDCMQGLKNAYKGIRGSLPILSMLKGTNVNYLTIPLGLSMGILAALNRVLSSQWKKPREKIQTRQKALLKKIRAITTEECAILKTNNNDHEAMLRLSKNKDAIVLVSDKDLYFIDHYKKEVREIKVGKEECNSFNKLTFNDDFRRIANTDELILIKNLTGRSTVAEDYKELLVDEEKLLSKIPHLKIKAYLSAVYGSIVDGLYLYVSVISLCPLAPTAFILAAAISAVYFLTCVTTRFYEEYEAQKQLKVSNATIAFELACKQIHFSLAQLEILEDIREPWLYENKLKNKILNDLNLIKQTRDNLSTISKTSAAASFISGLKDAMVAYQAITSILFAISTIFLLFTITFPPFLLMGGVFLGIPALLILGISSLTQNKQLNLTQQRETAAFNQIFTTFNSLTDLNINNVTSIRKTLTNINHGFSISRPTNNSNWFEMVRSFFSGLAKGSKASDFIMNPLQQAGSDGHYHDTPFMLIIMLFNSLFYASTLALRAFTRAFSGDFVRQINSQDLRTSTNPFQDSQNGSHPNTPPELKKQSSTTDPRLFSSKKPSTQINSENYALPRI